MARVCLLAPTIAGADAVGNDIAGMFTTLRARGIETHAFAERWTPDVHLPVRPVGEYEILGRAADTLTIYHHSVHSEDAAPRFLQSVGPRVLRYHNVTPSHFFAPYSEELARATELGREQTRALVAAGRIDLFLPDSDFNARELYTHGAVHDRCHTLPPFHTLPAMDALQAAVPVVERFLDGHYHVVFIGRVAPNKGHRHLLHVVAAYQRLFRRPLRLLCVGAIDGRVPVYQAELRALAQRLGVADAVVWTGQVSAAELKAYLLLAHAFVSMSEHEGFCVPIIEAMAHSVPVVALGSAAVRETVGDAGIVLDGLEYDEYAAALELLFSHDEHRAAFERRGRRRVAERFDSNILAQRFGAVLDPLLRGLPAYAPAEDPSRP